METTTSPSVAAPVVTRDPRFAAGRKLVQESLASEGAIEIFATLLEDMTTVHGEASVECAPAYYEYGNALLRAAMKDSVAASDNPVDPESARAVAAAAAEARQKATVTNDDESDKKPAALPSNKGDKENTENETNNEELGEENDDDQDQADSSDLELALEMMENAYSILEEYDEAKEDTPKYKEWAMQETPRILLGIGDCLSALERHADAADVYTRALDIRQEQLSVFEKDDLSLAHLQAHRRLCEATVLVAEELLACPGGQDVVTTETQSMMVKADERVEYARGYYDKARDALQDTVYTMGNLASKNVDLGSEKEDVCFIATLVMGVGTSLATIDGEDAASEVGASEPVKKRAKQI